MTRDPLTYRHPRTAIEAFGCDARQSAAVERFRPALHRRIVFALLDVLLVCSIGVGIAALLFFGASS